MDWELDELEELSREELEARLEEILEAQEALYAEEQRQQNEMLPVLLDADRQIPAVEHDFLVSKLTDHARRAREYDREDHIQRNADQGRRAAKRGSCEPCRLYCLRRRVLRKLRVEPHGVKVGQQRVDKDRRKRGKKQQSHTEQIEPVDL